MTIIENAVADLIRAELRLTSADNGDPCQQCGAMLDYTWRVKDGNIEHIAKLIAALPLQDGQDLGAERRAIADETRRYASHYPAHSDGRNTFVMLADWIEARGASAGWRPIETAPKEAFAVEFGLWNADTKRWNWLTHGAWDPDRKCWSDWQPIEPTHWRPIGEPHLLAEEGKS